MGEYPTHATPPLFVTPAKAGVSGSIAIRHEMPSSAGMTGVMA